MIAEKVKRWLIKATEDLKVIEHEIKLSEEEMAKGAVCFHCQQFVEKLLKAYLTSKAKREKSIMSWHKTLNTFDKLKVDSFSSKENT